MKLTSEALLQFARENGMLDVAQVQAQYEMKKRKEMLEQHNLKIWQGTDGKWRTYLPEPEGKRRLVKRSTREAIETAVIEFYEIGRRERAVTFQKAYFKWRNFQDQMVGDNTVANYNSDYR